MRTILFSASFLLAIYATCIFHGCLAWNIPSSSPAASISTSAPEAEAATAVLPQLSRRDFVIATTATTTASIFVPEIVQAFDGSGSSSYAGRTPLERAAKAKAYRERIVQDVKDFNRLGIAIDQGDTDIDNSNAWISFFIPYQRREPDSSGRSYAALLDMLGVERTGSGGAALLLATTYAKPNKPPNNLPQYKKYENLFGVFEPIKAAGKSGDAVKAKKEWTKAAAALSAYLETVELPSDLKDPIYK